jgi:hypothetical protein
VTRQFGGSLVLLRQETFSAGAEMSSLAAKIWSGII